MKKYNKYDYKNIRPFKFFMLQNFPFIIEDFDALTNYELMCKLAREINKVIETTNLTGEELENLSNSFIDLQKYVEDYFSDLNLQTEIDNKLDEMAESGELADIINVQIFEDLNQSIEDIGTNLSTEIENRENADNELNDKIEKIKNMLSCYNITLTNHIIYDLLNNNYNQGMCIDNNNNMYVYVNVDNSTGYVLVFNINNFQLVRTIQNVQFYHGGDMCVDNNFLYGAGNSQNMSIIRYNLTTSERTEFNPFISVPEYNQTLGLANFDENNLICMVGTLQQGEPHIKSFSDIAFYKINKSSWLIEQITVTNDKSYFLDYFCFQSMEMLENKLYVMVSYPNMILELKLNDEKTNFNINKLYNIPERDLFGQRVGEMQGISIIKSNSFGENSFMVTSVVAEDNNNTLKSYMFNFDSELQNPLKDTSVNTLSITYRKIVTCNSQANQYVFYENGTDDFPFKTIKRALAFVNYSPIAQGKQIKLLSGTYLLSTTTYLNAVIVADNSQAGDIIFSGVADIYNSNIVFVGNSYKKIKFTNAIVLDNAKVTYRHCIFEDVARCMSQSEVNFMNCDFTDTDRQQIIFAREGSKVLAHNVTFSNNLQYFYVDGSGILFCNKSIADAKIQKSGDYFVYKTQ